MLKIERIMVKKTIRERRSIWTVTFDQKTLDKVANMKGNPDHLTYNEKVSFSVTQDVRNGLYGKVSRLNFGSLDTNTVDYTITLLDETDTDVKVRFDFDNNGRFEIVVKKNIGYMTTAFYKFFTFLITETPVFLE